MKKFLKIAAIVLGVCFCAVVGLFVWIIIFEPSDPTNIPRSISISISPSSKAGSTSEPEEDKEQETEGLRWYDTVEEAMEDDELIKGGDRFAMQIYEDIYKREGTVEIARAECGDSLIIFYMPKYNEEEKEQQEKKRLRSTLTISSSELLMKRFHSLIVLGMIQVIRDIIPVIGNMTVMIWW